MSHDDQIKTQSPETLHVMLNELKIKESSTFVFNYGDKGTFP